MPQPTPSDSGLSRRLGDFSTLPEALSYAAKGQTGLNVYSGRGDLLETLSWGALRDQAVLVAQRLLGAGLRRGDRVGLVATADGEFARLFLACQLAGLIPAPLPLPLAFGGRDTYVDHLSRMAAAAHASALIVPPNLLSWFPAAESLGLRLLLSPAQLAEQPGGSVPLQPTTPDEIGYLQFSSGSTRFPLGVAVTQKALMANLHGITASGLQVRGSDRTVSWLPLYHDMGLVGFFLAPLASQMSLDWMPTAEFARRPLEWLRLISRNRGTLSYAPSFGYELCVRRLRNAPPPEELDLSCWRGAGLGGDMIRPHHLRAFSEAFSSVGFRSTAFVPSYGMAEATLALSFAPLDQGMRTDEVDLDRLENEGIAAAPEPGHRSRSFVLCGPPLPGHVIEARDEAGQVLPDRHVGRLFASGPSLMLGYDGRPDETAQALSADGWLDTGDLGYRLGGEVVITGRAKDLIIVNGRNIWPQDLEWTVEHAASRAGEVAAFTVEFDPDTGLEELIVLVEARTSEAQSRQELLDEAASAIRQVHGLEGRVILVPPGSLPHTSSGKLSRSRSRQLYQAGAFKMTAAEALPG
ncbi:fatty acyl-AMP ligase [Roseomonas elaeocarpi]|uniref:Fatty acyl-AMP ligase n=1 Tax=Roseomonas elaeocarpi TaxID=907779 RepID=A0ABV6JQN3_9PROT